MGFCQSGIKAKLRDVSLNVQVCSRDPLIRLANLIDWADLATIADADLKMTKNGFWWVGRKINLRTHLSTMILQLLLKTTDRGIEIQVTRSPLYQVFCGRSIVANWKCPDHTKIEVFRNRLAPKTQKKISDYIVCLAVEAGFANPSSVDIDSTVQEANMSYPSDSTLMRKLAQKCFKVIEFMRKTKKNCLPDGIDIDIKAIAQKAKEYFFLGKKTAIDKRRKVFKEYHSLITDQLSPAIKFLENLSPTETSRLPWNIKHSLNQISTHARKYLKDVAHFVKTHTMKTGKVLSFHCFQVACIKKGKVGKDKEFGRVIQLGRIVGNFVIAYSSTSVRMDDKQSLVPIVIEHEKIFGKGILKDIATDKGYYSAKNIREIESLGVLADGIQRPGRVKNKPEYANVVHLNNRRAGVEPIIGHVKEFGLRRSKMKSDRAALSQAYRSVAGFNLHQMNRHLAKVG